MSKDALLDGEIIRTRGAAAFEQRYLRKGFQDKITVLRILDLRRENFKISKPYEHKIAVINVITAPEIEILIILNERKYDAYKRSKKKPRVYLKTKKRESNC